MQVFENAIWLFALHPFDVGDVIRYAGDRYTVKSIKLQRLSLARVDGADVMVPTEQMRSALIHNISRCDCPKGRLLVKHAVCVAVT